MHLELLSARMKEHVENVVDYMILEVEFTHAHQEDGHMPAHGDMDRDFAEAIIRNIPREPIAKLLEENNIKGLKIGQSGYGVKVKTTERSEFFMPVFEMEIRIPVTREENQSISLANQLLGTVTYPAVKAAIAAPGNYYYYSDVGGLQ